MTNVSPSQMVDPGASVIVAVAEWIEGTLLGSMANGIAVIAVAGMGFAMLAGQLDWRRGVRVVLGCFILFGASTIAHGLADLMGSSEGAATAAIEPFTAPQIPPTQPKAIDPYAGASVPM